MEITYKSVAPAQNYAQSALRFTFSLKFGRSQESPIHVSGKLSIQDKIIGFLNLETPLPASNLQALRFRGADTGLGDVLIDITMSVVLNRYELDMVERSRRDNKKGDVEFKLSVSVRYLRNLAELSQIKVLPLNNVPFAKQYYNEVAKILNLDAARIPIELLFHAFQGGEYYQNNSNLLFVVENAEAVGNNPGGGYLITETLNREYNERIHSSDWINDFAPVFGLGEFFVVEIPTGNKTIKDAWELISKAEMSYKKWDIEGVASSCRLVGQNLDGYLKEKFGEKSFTYNERWGRIYGAAKTGFKGWVSMPLHSEDIKNEGAGGAKYERPDVKSDEADAESILLITKALIKYAEKLVHDSNRET